MPSVCRGTAVACINSCFSTPFPDPVIPDPNQGNSTAPLLLPETHFTNHESLPSLSNAFLNFIANNPKYTSTELADYIRDHDYRHLSNHVCFDYTGFGLLSGAQLSSPPEFSHKQAPSFNIVYKSVTLKSQLQYGDQETAVESAIRRRIMNFLKISGDEYTMVCTANKSSAFKILAESYPFHSNKKLLTVYDHESEAVRLMVSTAKKKGAKVSSAEFQWPSMKIHSEKLKKMVKKKEKKRGLFVFPPQSQMTGSKYPYQWMSLAQESGWHVVLDACSMGPKDMNSLGLSLIEADFIVCSFFKNFGDDPSGFAGLFIKNSSKAILDMSTTDRSTGIISIIPPKRPCNLPVPDDLFEANSKTQPSNAEDTSPSSGLSLSLKRGKTKKSYELIITRKEVGEPSSRNMQSHTSADNMEVGPVRR